MASLLFDLRTALRAHLRQPAFAATVVVSLALAIAALTAVFEFVYPALLRPLPYPHPRQLVEVTMSEPAGGAVGGRVSYPDYRDLAEQSRSFTTLAAVSEESMVLSGVETAERLAGARVSPGFFTAFDLPASRGGVPLERWHRGEPLAAISDGFWRRHFAGDRDVLGRTLRLDDRSSRRDGGSLCSRLGA